MNEDNDVMEVTIKVEANPCQVFWQKCRRLWRCPEDWKLFWVRWA